MACCRCNRTGTCKGCACVKAGERCAGCLPSKLGRCLNHGTVAAAAPEEATVFSAVTTTAVTTTTATAVTTTTAPTSYHD